MMCIAAGNARSSFESIQTTLSPLREYQDTLEKMVALPHAIFLSRSRATELKTLCSRVQQLHVASILIRLKLIQKTGVLSSDESRLCFALEPSLYHAQRSTVLMISNLDLILCALASSSEEALKFPKVAVPLALAYLKGYRCEAETVIASGASGKVSKVTIFGMPYVMKTIHPQHLEDVSNAMIRGAILSHSVGSRHLVEIVGIGASHEVFMEEGAMSVTQALKENPSLFFRNLPQYVHQMLEGLFELHRKELTHRDIKPYNMVIVSDLIDPSKTEVKIVDFDSIAKDGSIQPFAGTPLHLSPQLCHFVGKPHVVSKTDDLWALGISLYQLLSGRKWIQELDAADSHVLLFLKAARLHQADVDLAIESLYPTPELITSLADSKLTEAMVQMGIPLAQKILIEEGLKLFSEESREPILKSPQELLSKGIEVRLRVTGREKLMEFIAHCGKDQYIEKFGSKAYVTLQQTFGIREFRHLQQLLAGLLQVLSSKRLTAEAALNLYVDLRAPHQQQLSIESLIYEAQIPKESALEVDVPSTPHLSPRTVSILTPESAVSTHPGTDSSTNTSEPPPFSALARHLFPYTDGPVAAPKEPALESLQPRLRTNPYASTKPKRPLIFIVDQKKPD